MRKFKVTENKIKGLCQDIQTLLAKTTLLMEKKTQETGMQHVRVPITNKFL